MKARIVYPSKRAKVCLAILGLAAWIGLVYWATTNGGPAR